MGFKNRNKNKDKVEKEKSLSAGLKQKILNIFADGPQTGDPKVDKLPLKHHLIHDFPNKKFMHLVKPFVEKLERLEVEANKIMMEKEPKNLNTFKTEFAKITDESKAFSDKIVDKIVGASGGWNDYQSSFVVEEFHLKKILIF